MAWAAWRAGRRREGRPASGGARYGHRRARRMPWCLGMAGQLTSLPHSSSLARWGARPRPRPPSPPSPSARAHAACATTTPYPRTPRELSPDPELYGCHRFHRSCMLYHLCPRVRRDRGRGHNCPGGRSTRCLRWGAVGRAAQAPERLHKSLTAHLVVDLRSFPSRRMQWVW